MSGDPEISTFLSFDSEKKIETENIENEAEIIVEMVLSKHKYTYERSVYTIFTLIGDIGGFNGAIVILPTLLMAMYSERMYQGSI